MGDYGAYHRILKLCLMEVDDDVHFFFSNELGHGETSFFGEGSIRAARPCSIQISDINIGQFLAAGIVNIDLWIWPLVERIRPAVSHPEFLFSP